MTDGDGTFAPKADYDTGHAPQSVTAADLDTDGDLDLATGNAYSDNVSVLLNQGEGTFAADVLYSAGDGPASVTAADLDGDGDLDLAVANSGVWGGGDDNVSVLLNQSCVDCNGNGVADAVDIAEGTSLDCNTNTLPDDCDITEGTSQDKDGNGIPDECDPPPADCEGDANDDNAVDPLDAGFVSARFGCSVGTGDEECDAADVSGDGLVDPLDLGFVLARFGACL